MRKHIIYKFILRTDYDKNLGVLAFISDRLIHLKKRKGEGLVDRTTQLNSQSRRQHQKLIPSFMNRDVMSGFVFSGLNP